MRTLKGKHLAAAMMAAMMVAGTASAQTISITTAGSPYTQSFDAPGSGFPLTGSVTWAKSDAATLSALAGIPGWYYNRTGTGTTLVADIGSSNSGNLYSYGAASNNDRSLGTLGSGNAAVGSFGFGAIFQNNTGGPVASVTISYNGEQWRNSAAAAQTAAFSYQVSASAPTGFINTAFTDVVTALDFTSPVTGGTAGAIDGNVAGRVPISNTITFGTPLAAGEYLTIKWSDPDQGGADHGLAIDDVSVTFNAAAAAPEIAVEDVDNSNANVADNNSPAIDIGSQTVGGAALTRTFRVRNTGTVDLTATLGSNPTGYTVTEGLTSPITAGGSDTFTIELGTGSAATFPGTFTITNNDSDENPFELNVTGTITAAAAPEMALVDVTGGNAPVADNAAAIDVGTATVGASALSRTFRVENNGTANLTVSLGALPVGYTVTEPLTSPISASGNDTFTIELSTAAPGTFAGGFQITNNDSDENPYDVNVTGQINAGAAPVLQTVVSTGPNTLNLIFDKAMTTAGTYTATPGGAGTVDSAAGNTVSVTFGGGLSAFPATSALDITGAQSTDLGSANVTALPFVAGITPLASARTMVDGTGAVSATYANHWMTVAGVVVDNGIVDERNVVLADASNSAGLNLRDNNATTFGSTRNLGDTLVGSGRVGAFNGLLQLSDNFPFLGTGTPGTAPAYALGTVPALSTFATAEPVESTNRRIEDAVVTNVFSSGSGATITVRGDEPNTIDVRFDIDAFPVLPTFAVGDRFTFAQGWLSQFDSSAPNTSGYQVMVLTSGDYAMGSGSNEIVIEDADNSGAFYPVNGPTIDLGTVTVGDASPTRTFTVRNIGSAAMAITSVTTPAGYSISEALDANIPTLSSDTFTVSLSTAAPGTFAGQVTVNNDDATEFVYTINVTGTVNPPASVSDWSVIE